MINKSLCVIAKALKNIDIWAEVCYNTVAQAKRVLAFEPQTKPPRNCLSVGVSIRLEARTGPMLCYRRLRSSSWIM